MYTNGLTTMAPAPSDTVCVACGADDLYAMPLAVTVRSLVENLDADARVRLFVIDGGLTASSRRRLLDSWPRDRLDVEWVKPDLSALGGVNVSGHIPVASYFRLLVADLLPPSVTRVVYLDSDLVVLDSLTKLWAVDLAGHPWAAVQDLNAPYVSRPNGLTTWGELRLPADRKYWNAGVLVLDLDRWRREGLGAKVLSYVRQNRRIRWHDQDGLNAVLGGDCLELDHRWNLSIQNGAGPSDPAVIGDLDALVRAPSICHFSSHVKPWHTDCDHPRKQLFFDYLARTAWSGFRPTRRSDEVGAVRELRKVASYTRDRGAEWTALYLLRSVGGPVTRLAERRMVAIEKRRFLVGPETMASRQHTREENRRWWDRYDWSRSGEEWTEAASDLRGIEPAEWKQTLLDGVLSRHIRSGGTIVEIGPGAGRWTEHLVPLAARLFLVDVSERCLDLCRRRFADATNVEYHRVESPALSFLPDGSIDSVWSYDAFVHINPTDTDHYLGELARVLRPGGTGVIHHSGTYADADAARRALRSHVTAEFFAELVRRRGLELVEQDTQTPHMPGDVISIFRKRSHA